MNRPEQGTLEETRSLEPREPGRVRDSQATLAWVVDAVARGVRSGREGGALRTYFEHVLQEALGVPRVWLRDQPLSCAAPVVGAPDSVRRIAVHVPTAHGAPPAVLEAALEVRIALADGLEQDPARPAEGSDQIDVAVGIVAFDSVAEPENVFHA